MAAQRTYTDAQRTDALVRLTANGNALRKTARETGIPETTLRQWFKGTSAPEARQASAVKLKPTADDCSHLAGLFLKQLLDRREMATYRDLLVGFGILTDKAAILRSAADQYEATDDPDLSLLTPEQLETINEWVESARAGAVSSPVPDGELCPVDVASVPVELAPPGIVPVPGQVSNGDYPPADGVHATEAREV